jgi:phenylalanyl-tRNA synthetase beta chain
VKVSELWLREWVNPTVSTDEISHQLTMAGLEVDGLEKRTVAFSGVIVVKVESANVLDDKYVHYVVTDSSTKYNCVSIKEYHLPVGTYVPFAPVGSSLISGIVEGKSIAGMQVDGMLCAKESLGIEEQSSSHWFLPNSLTLGSDLAAQLIKDDNVIEIDLTPNRGDCLSIQGIAREISAINNSTLNAPKIPVTKPSHNDIIDVEINAEKACTHYVGRIIKDISTNVVTPLWMQEKLDKVGVRVIHPIVDITNYVMMELGQPMHAFDFSNLDGKIEVRYAKKAEKITLLDGAEIECDEDTLLIADKNKPLALAGIMGGVGSETTDSSTNIFLESALFEAPLIATKARQYGISSDSAYRFERGVDYNLQNIAIERATQLILEICGGSAGPIIDKTSKYHPSVDRQISFSLAKINSITGLTLAFDKIKKFLESLGFTILDVKDDLLKIQVPSYRYDVSRQEDIAEEIARMHGYDNIPEVNLPSGGAIGLKKKLNISNKRIKQFFADRGFVEAITYSFISPKLHKQLGFGDALELKNPIASDMSIMRTSLWPGLIQTLIHNMRRQQQDVQIFEQGLVFIPGKELAQVEMLGALITGKNSTSWNSDNSQVDFFSLKGLVESLWELSDNTSLTFCQAKIPMCHPNQCAEFSLDGNKIGLIGRLHPQLEKQLDFIQPVYLFEAKSKHFKELIHQHCEMPSKFPQIRRDLAFILEKSQPTGELLDFIKNFSNELIKNVDLFDLYEGKGVPQGHKSIALGLILQHSSRTLVDIEVEELVAKLIKDLNKKFGAQLRE